MEPNHQDQNKHNDLINAKNNFKAGFYTLIIFAIVVFIWIYTNPFFKPSSASSTNISESLTLQPSTIEKVDSVGQSFNTMWSGIIDSVNQVKK